MGSIIPLDSTRRVVTKGKTPVLTPEETRQFLDSIPPETLTGLRDRALIGLLVYREAVAVSAARHKHAPGGETLQIAQLKGPNRPVVLDAQSNWVWKIASDRRTLHRRKAK